MPKNTSKNSSGHKQRKKRSKSTKVAIVYDRVNKWGGAERVLLALHKVFPDAPLYTSLYDAEGAKWSRTFQVIPSFLQKLPFLRKSHEYLAPFMPMAFETLDLTKFDIVISVTSEAAKGVITPPHTRHICICLTPTRYLYSGYDEYIKDRWFEAVARPVLWYLKLWDKVAAARPDTYVAISKTVKSRIQNIYGRQAQLLYPPIHIKKSQQDTSQKDYFLVVSRMVGYKRIDLAIHAANKLHVPLKIVGEGRLEKELRDIAGPTIEFEGFVTESKLIKLYTDAKALIFPGNEDLGLTMIEAQACGTPVIALRKGGATEVVKEGVTGEFFEDQTVDSLAGAMEKFERAKYNNKKCIENGTRFSFEKFKADLIELLKDS